MQYRTPVDKMICGLSPLPLGQFACSRILSGGVRPLFSVNCHHRCEERGDIYIYFCVSCTVRKNSFVIPSFVHSFHSFCHCSFVSCSISLIGVFIGILLKTILAALSHAAAFASRSASSFPTIHTWVLTHDISMFQSALSKLVIFFLISSTK